MNTRCTTHHHACDCREEKLKQMEQEFQSFRDATSFYVKEYVRELEQQLHEVRARDEGIEGILEHLEGALDWLERIDCADKDSAFSKDQCRRTLKIIKRVIERVLK